MNDGFLVGGLVRASFVLGAQSTLLWLSKLDGLPTMTGTF